MSNTDYSLGLRKRVLLSSISLAIVVSVIFISVAYNLSRELGQSLEIEHSNKMLLQLFKSVKHIAPIEKNSNFGLNEEAKNELLSLLDQDVVGFEIWINQTHVKLKTLPFYNRKYEIANSVRNKESSYGFIENDSGMFSWVYQYSLADDISILMVYETHVLDKAINYVSNRLTITSFFTFWLTIWVALFISALITKRFEQSNNRLKYLATHDVLTGLPNRAYLYEHAKFYLSEKNINKHQKSNTLLAIYIIDLDKFKDINDTMGHLVGDELLKVIAKRLSNLKEKNSQVLRYGGDEFVVWCDDLDENRAISLAEDIVLLCRQPINVNNYVFETSVSVGVAFYPTSGKQLIELLKNADIAMYQAKKHRLGYQIYQQNLFSRSEFRMNLKGQLNAALEKDQFVLHYQPKVQLANGRIVGVEALVRWMHPVEGLLMPNMFIDIVEQSVFVHEFTRHIMLQAVIQCRKWLDGGVELPIAVNISPYNLMDPELVRYLADILMYYKVSPALIEVELTENASMVNIYKTQEVFKQLKELGVKLSIDDFGTGMSSLAYIKSLDVDFIKIDRSFINDVITDSRDEAVISSVLVLCQKLNKLTIAEGVENIAQANKLTRLGCDLAQGYLYSKAISAEEVMKLLHTNKIAIGG